MAFDRAFACGVYEGAISASVLALKKQPVIARHLKDAIRGALARNPFVKADFIVPVPLSKKRMFERGFNQAEKIADVVSRLLDLPINSSLLQRTIHTPLHRAGMDLRARELSVEKAFSVVNADLVGNKRILLVDDVFTSGETVNSCSTVLKKSGASFVTVFTIARAVQGRY
ncbi:MAG: ComF family protein [Acidobacteria bacterium]|nr:ComF family protein [Acidobacteriota bacterium]